MSERETYLANPDIEQRIVSAPAIGDPIRMGIKKADPAWRNHLKKMKKGAGRGNLINDL